jgi:prepilin-type N-terminal cleavage/methylation domain-containing protein/prepilin-type processing-associated H-X9-DG protein
MRRARAGFTLTEVVAVVGIIAVILGLIIPALANGRGAARRSQCANNFKQILLGLQNYESQFQTLPPGVVDFDAPIHNRPEGLHTGWIVSLLPFMEQRALAEAIDTNRSVYEQVNAVATSNRIRTLRCPSDPYDDGPTSPAGISSYAGCHHDVEAPIDVDNHGVFFLNSHVRREDITDGTSFTFFVGEKPLKTTDLGWASGTRATLRNTGTRLNDPATLRDDLTGLPGAAEALAVGGFGSYHPGGAHFGFGDGSVRFISESINLSVYRHLGNREDGELISASDFVNDTGSPLRQANKGER